MKTLKDVGLVVLLLALVALFYQGVKQEFSSPKTATPTVAASTRMADVKLVDPSLGAWMAGGPSNYPAKDVFAWDRRALSDFSAARVASSFLTLGEQNDSQTLIMVRQGACAAVSVNSVGEPVVSYSSTQWKSLFAPKADCAGVKISSRVESPVGNAWVAVYLSSVKGGFDCLTGNYNTPSPANNFENVSAWSSDEVPAPNSCAGIATFQPTAVQAGEWDVIASSKEVS